MLCQRKGETHANPAQKRSQRGVRLRSILCIVLALVIARLIFELHGPGNTNSPADWIFPVFALLAAVGFGVLAWWVSPGSITLAGTRSPRGGPASEPPGDLNNGLSPEALDILRMAHADGYAIALSPERNALVLNKHGAFYLWSDQEIRAFGQEKGWM